VILALAVHRAKGVNPDLKGSKDPQGQREILQTPAACKTLKTALPNWKKDSRRPASVVSQKLLNEVHTTTPTHPPPSRGRKSWWEDEVLHPACSRIHQPAL